jgi:hypothetical protein
LQDRGDPGPKNETPPAERPTKGTSPEQNVLIATVRSSSITNLLNGI